MLSVIVPIYNSYKYLNKCIMSIVNQSYMDIEIILVDDGSLDESYELCNRYADMDQRIKLHRQEHQGPFAARKLGVEKAIGNYITFVDADDYIDIDSYSMASKDMEMGIDIIAFGIKRFCDDNIFLDSQNIKYGKYNREDIEKNIFGIMIWDENTWKYGVDPSLCNKIFKSHLIKKIFDEINNLNFHYGEDVAVVYPAITYAKTMSFHQEAYYYHRQRSYGDIAPYLNDDDYLDKLYSLYQHLNNCIDLNIFKKQIDMFYMYSVQLYLKKYNKYVQSGLTNIFPFDKVDKGDRVIIYGAGNVGKIYIDQLSKIQYCNIVLWVDSNYQNYNEDVKAPSIIKSVIFDKVIIAVENKNVRKVIFNDLINIGVSPDKIV